MVFVSSAIAQPKAGRIIEICHPVLGFTVPAEDLWNFIEITGFDEFGVRQSKGFQPKDKCAAVPQLLWTGRTKVEFNSIISGLPTVTHEQVFEISPTFIEEPFRCDPDILPSSLRANASDNAV